MERSGFLPRKPSLFRQLLIRDESRAIRVENQVRREVEKLKELLGKRRIKQIRKKGKSEENS